MACGFQPRIERIGKRSFVTAKCLGRQRDRLPLRQIHSVPVNCVADTEIRQLFDFAIAEAREGILLVRHYQAGREPPETIRVYDAEGKDIHGERVPFARSIAGSAVGMQAPCAMSGLDRIGRDAVASAVELHSFEKPHQSVLAAPMMVAPGLQAILELFDKPGGKFTEDDLRLVKTAQTEVKGARELAAGAERALPYRLEQRLAWLESELTVDEKDRQLAAAFDQVRVERSTIVEGKFNDQVALQKYPRLFRNAGLDVEKGTPEAVARRIRQSRVGGHRLEETRCCGRSGLPARCLRPASNSLRTATRRRQTGLHASRRSIRCRTSHRGCRRRPRS